MQRLGCGKSRPASLAAPKIFSASAPSLLHAAGMKDLSDLLIAEQIKQLKARYFLALDRRDAAAYNAVFGPTGVFDISQFDVAAIEAGRVPPGPVLRGGEEIAGFVLPSLDGIRSGHRGFNPMIEIVSADEARATWAMEDWFQGPDGAIRLAGFGYYEDVYKRTDGAWVIAHSKLIRWGNTA